MSRRTDRRNRVAVVDASLGGEGVAGLGVALIGGHPLAADAALVGEGGIQLAEGLAITRGLCELAVRRAKRGSLVISDNQSIVNAINRRRPPETLGGVEVVEHARMMMREFGFDIEWRPRAAVRPAHRMAQAALDVWRAGSVEGETWGVPVPAMLPPEAQ